MAPAPPCQRPTALRSMAQQTPSQTTRSPVSLLQQDQPHHTQSTSSSTPRPDVSSTACSLALFRVCSTLTLSARERLLPSLVSSTHSVVSSSAKCTSQKVRRVVVPKLTTIHRYWGTSETLLPVYQSVEKAIAKHDDVDTIVNFASSRSVYSSTMELMEYPQVKTIAIIAEGVPERVSSTPYDADVRRLTFLSVRVRSSMLPSRRASQSLAQPPLVVSSQVPSKLVTLVV